MNSIFTVIDTNVLVSAILKGNSYPEIIIQNAFSGKITPVINDKILAEYKNVLSRPKFNLTEQIINDILVGLIENSVYSDGAETNKECLDPDDIVFYAVTVEKRKTGDTCLVTSNIRHFPIESFIFTPRQFVENFID